MSNKFLLVTTVKNEGPNILEWVAYHRVIGFDTIHVYQNDSSDETQKSLRTLDRLGIIKYFRNDCPRKQWQNKAYRRTSFHDDYSAHDWCMALDGDEFLNVKIGDGNVRDLVAEYPEADEIRLNWRNFGCSGHIKLSDDLVIDRYTQCDAEDRIKVARQGVKTLFRTKEFRRPGIHMPRVPKREDRVILNGSGIPWFQLKDSTWRSVDPGLRKSAQVNHYPVRDLSSFLLKTARGSSSHVDREIGMKYWGHFNYYDSHDVSIWRRSEAVHAEMARLNAASNGRLFILRERGLELWQEKLDELLAREDVQQLRATLLTTIPGQAAKDTTAKRKQTEKSGQVVSRSAYKSAESAA